MAFLGIDIGGTGVKAALVDENGQILSHAETPTRAYEGATALLDRVEQLGRSLLGQASVPVTGCGVGSAGRIDHRRGTVVYATQTLPGWTGVAIGPELHRRLGLPVTVDNDVNAAALAEGWLGAARGTADYLTLTLGTGVGGAVVIGGKIWRGARWGAGEVGHMALYPGGLPCACGGKGCAEQYISAKALTRRANAALGQPAGHAFRGIREVLSTAEAGREERRKAAREGVAGFVSDLALFLVNIQQAFDPQVIVVGGGILRLGYWWDRLMEALSHETRPRSLHVRLKKAQFGPQAGVVGAARMAMLARDRAGSGQGRRRERPGPHLPVPQVSEPDPVAEAY